jgi:FAD/FMN-containing dehydrogenase/Fe-S oxidoreductase
MDVSIEDHRAASLNELGRRIDGDVSADPVGRVMAATDGSIFQKLPAAVVYPRSEADVAAAVAFAADNRLSVHPRGAGSGLCGAALGDGLVVDFSRYMNRLIHLDTAGGWFACEPGFRLGELDVALAGTGLFFPPDPSSGEYATFGGMVGTNASGAHSVKYGNVADYILDLRVVLADGTVVDLAHLADLPLSSLGRRFQALYRLYEDHRDAIEAAYPDIRFNTAGYNMREMVKGGRLDLRRLFAGAEGTLGLAVRLRFRLIEKPAHDSLVVAFMPDIQASARAVAQVLPMGPAGIEIMDKSLLGLAREEDPDLGGKFPSDVDNVLLIEFDGSDRDACAGQAAAVEDRLRADGLTDMAYTAVSVGEKQKFWAVRKAAVPILYKLKGEKKILALIEDAAVPIPRLAEYIDGLYKILDRHQIRFVIYGHIAKGLLHTRPLLNLKEAADVEMLRTLADDVFDLVSRLGGSVSGEHGDGRLRSPYIRKRYPEIFGLFGRLKKVLDPDGIFNPEIITAHDPDQMKRALRFGPDYAGRDRGEITLQWQEGFAREIEKCHGCSKCTTVTTATRMCPVYKFTRDEAATPRAKANVLRGLISGTLPAPHLFAAAFQRVMKYCVNCGSCHKECPSAVNIPKMAMEARARYVRRFGAPLTDRVLVSVEAAGRYTRPFSKVSAPLMDQPLVRKAAERFVGISARRRPVVFPARSLFDRLPEQSGGGDLKVLYFSGCYAGYIRPEIGEAAVDVMRAAGATVYLPKQHCCGLPMISKGMAMRAKKKVIQNLDRWEDLAARADHIVVTCSSCGLALMQEWEYLLDPERARAIREKLVHISTLILDRQRRLTFMEKPLVTDYHAPCHLRVQPHAKSSLDLLALLPGVTARDLASHCCGMAGAWGMTGENFDLSRAIGSEMIEKLDNSDGDVGVTDCPTCRMQMEQFSRKPIYHPVEIVARHLIH